MIDRVVGNYRIVEKVGEGGMGAVYRAVDLLLEREVAIKAIRPELSRDPEIVERFRAEAKMLARVSHPAIATIFSFFVQGEDLFFIMEYVRGQNLSRLLKSAGSLPWERAVPLLAGALEGIEQAHRAGIVHRDIKPDNLMITESGTVKVMDFGIARLIDGNSLTRTGLVIGTLRYMAPEQLRGEKVDRRTDVYALGTVLYEMVTGRLPFAGGSDYALLKAKIEGEPAPPSAAMPGLPAWLDQAVLTAMAQDPARRFQTVDELRVFLLTHGAAHGAPPLAAAAYVAPPTPATGTAAVSSADQPTLVKVPVAGLPQPPPQSPRPSPPPPARLSPTRVVAAPDPTTTTPTMRLAAAPTVPAATPTSIAESPTATAPTAGSYREIGVPFRSAAVRRRALLLAALAVAAVAAVAILYRQFPSPLTPPREPAEANASAGGRAEKGSAAPGARAFPGSSAGPSGSAGSGTGVPAAGAVPGGAGGTGGASTPGTGPLPPQGDVGLAKGRADPGSNAVPGGSAGGSRAEPGSGTMPSAGALAAPPAPTAPAAPATADERQPLGKRSRRAAGAATPANRDAKAATAEAPPPAAERRGAPAEPPSTAREEAPAAAAPSGGSEAGSGAAGAELPTDELGSIGADLDKESGDLRNLYADHLSRKEKGGSELTKADDRLKDELKNFQNTAERFHSQFQPGFFARTRIRVGRISHGEDERRQIARLAREMIDSGARVDPLMAEARPDSSVTQLWHRMRRQWKRVADLCGL